MSDWRLSRFCYIYSVYKWCLRTGKSFFSIQQLTVDLIRPRATTLLIGISSWRCSAPRKGNQQLADSLQLCRLEMGWKHVGCFSLLHAKSQVSQAQILCPPEVGNSVSQFPSSETPLSCRSFCVLRPLGFSCLPALSGLSPLSFSIGIITLSLHNYTGWQSPSPPAFSPSVGHQNIPPFPCHLPAALCGPART